MAKPCGICGSERNYTDDPTGERTRIDETLRQFDSLTKSNLKIRADVEGTLFSEQNKSLNNLKARYIELLSQREKLTKRVFEQREQHRKKRDSDNEQERIIADLQEYVSTTERELSFSTTIADGLTDVLRDQAQELYVRRMQGAVSIFRMMHVEAHPPSRKAPHEGPGQVLALTGCSSIMSMPLPNSGNFSGVPLDVVTTAVSHIAHLVDALSGILNVPLPHPLYPFEAADCLVSAQHDLWARAQVRGSCFSLAPAALMHDRANFRDFDWTTLHELSHCQLGTGDRRSEGTGDLGPQPGRSPQPAPAFQYKLPVVVKAKEGELRHSEYSLNPNFPTALVLLQADIIALCLRAGLQAEDLWPPEAMLFSLSVLSRHCEGIVHRHASTLPHVSVAAAMPVVYSSEALGEMSRVLDDATLGSLRDRYGSAARHESAEASSSGRESEETFMAEFVPEESGLDRENEWDVVTIQSVV